jgi:ABC-type phosphate transport system ATPase subunit
MPLSDDTIVSLSQEALNELAILEDRALRAEGQYAAASRKLTELQAEITKLREEVGMLLQLSTELQEFAQGMADDARIEAGRVEEQLRRFLVVQAG